MMFSELFILRLQSKFWEYILNKNLPGAYKLPEEQSRKEQKGLFVTLSLQPGVMGLPGPRVWFCVFWSKLTFGIALST